MQILIDFLSKSKKGRGDQRPLPKTTFFPPLSYILLFSLFITISCFINSIKNEIYLEIKNTKLFNNVYNTGIQGALRPSCISIHY